MSGFKQLEGDKTKMIEIAAKILGRLTKEEQISLICSFANWYIDELGTDERFEIIQENIHTKTRRKLVFSREDCEEETEETK